MSGHFSPIYHSGKQSQYLWTVCIGAFRPGIPEKTLKMLEQLCVCNTKFLFNGKVYKKIDGLAMGSSLGPLLANIYWAHLEEHQKQLSISILAFVVGMLKTPSSIPF